MAYIEQFRVGLSLPVHFLLRVLRYYGIALPQLQPNGVKVMVAFYLHCLEMDVLPMICLFRAFFILKMTSSKGWFIFSSYRKLKVIIPNKVSNWKKKFFYFRIPDQQVPHIWRLY